MVKKWCNEEWAETRQRYRERRLLMPGVAHHQGNLALPAYAARYVSVVHLFFSDAQI